MQTVALWSPHNVELQLFNPSAHYTPLDATDPTDYVLTYDDFKFIGFNNGQNLYELKEEPCTAAWFSAGNVASSIIKAGTAFLQHDLSLPLGQRPIIPHEFFDQLELSRPEILDIIEYKTPNPLCGHAPLEAICTAWTQVQTVVKWSKVWINEAKARSDALGARSYWDWSAVACNRVGYESDYHLVTSGSIEHYVFGLDSTNDSSSTEASRGSTPDYIADDDVTMASEDSGIAFLPEEYYDYNSDYTTNTCRDLILHPTLSCTVQEPLYESENEENSCRDIVLHPTLSAFAKAFPEVDVFSGDEILQYYDCLH
ncbi:hypothetical protein GALMADRAFT_773625 [Galerina marginata CBS 339.88]|uniref:Uncharacterized protein n=1 Tax=Galerina marginata (strain CBS 339.88) TaxID=685588 RepID=A0A067SMA6_GALM3|nr:hypothetical protein GALMADRAFT_773625 [Galerina marginata CBS 339.88]